MVTLNSNKPRSQQFMVTMSITQMETGELVTQIVMFEKMYIYFVLLSSSNHKYELPSIV